MNREPGWWNSLTPFGQTVVAILAMLALVALMAAAGAIESM